MSDFRIGHGYDIHRLKDFGRLMLGGVCVTTEVSAIAHSDGDVVIHAIVDALFGAAGLGDIGEAFPNTEPAFKGVDSSVFLATAMAIVGEKGFRVVNCDITILAERPKLLPFKAEMKALLEKALNGAVNIKAGTNEGCGEIGRGEAVAAHAVVLLSQN